MEGDILKNYLEISRIITLLCELFKEIQNLRLHSQTRLPTRLQDKMGPTENAVKRTRMKGHKDYPEKDINKEITDAEV